MPQEPCKQCEEHAKKHANLFGIGPKEDCPDCLEHLELHKRERRIRWW